MFLENINNNTMRSRPTVTSDGSVWFRGSDNALWYIPRGGTSQSKPGNNGTLSSPFVTGDGWVWFQGTDNALWSMRPDGSQQSKPGNRTTKATPLVTPDGWVWFQGTDNALCRMRTDGSQFSKPGNNGCNRPPFVTADGWVWFQGTDNSLWRMRTDGTQQTKPGNNGTKSTPFVTADGWVWFQGTDNALWRMRTDGTQQSKPGNNGTASSPTVTVDGWVWFRGTDDKLWRMYMDGSHQTQVDGQWTASRLTVGKMTIANGVAGEWVYWRGTDNRLWRDLVPATALQTETGSPAYYVLTSCYSPPGTRGGNSGSSVVYSAGSSTGTITSTTQSFKEGTEVGPSDDAVTLGGTFSASKTTTDSSSLAINKSQTYSFQMQGPAHDGIDHDFDIFLLLLNPLIKASEYPQNVVTWTMGIESPTGTALIYLVYAGQLKGTMPMPPGLKAAFDARNMTQADFDQILSTNPYSSGSGTIDPNRFVSTPQSFPYMPPPDRNSSPVTFTLTLLSDKTQTATHEVTTEYSVGMVVSIGFLKDTTTFTWTSTNSTSSSQTTSQSASATVGGPSFGYAGPVTVLVYFDTLYNCFMFAFPAGTASLEGTVFDASGKPIEWTPVALTVDGERFTTFTDWQGEYKFYNTPDGPGTVTVGGHDVPVEVGGGETPRIEIPGTR